MTVSPLPVPLLGLHLKSVCTTFGPHSLVVAEQAASTPHFLNELKRKLTFSIPFQKKKRGSGNFSRIDSIDKQIQVKPNVRRNRADLLQ
jgi:hypothetical protein